MRSNANILREFIRESARLDVLKEQSVPDSARPELAHAIEFFYKNGVATGELQRLKDIMDSVEMAGSSDWIGDLGKMLIRASDHDNRDTDIQIKGATGLLIATFIETGDYNFVSSNIGKIADNIGRAILANAPSFGIARGGSVNESLLNEKWYDDAWDYIRPGIKAIGRAFGRGVSNLDEVPPELQKDAVEVMRRMIDAAADDTPDIAKNIKSGTFSVNAGQLPGVSKDAAGTYTIGATKGVREAFEESLLSATEVPLDQSLLAVIRDSGTRNLDPTPASMRQFLNNVDGGGPSGGAFRETFRSELEDHGIDEFGRAINASNSDEVADRMIAKVRKAYEDHGKNIEKLLGRDTLKDILNRALVATGRVSTGVGKKVAIGAGVVTAGIAAGLIADLATSPGVKSTASLTNDILTRAGPAAASWLASYIEKEVDEGEYAEVVTELRRLASLTF